MVDLCQPATGLSTMRRALDHLSSERCLPILESCHVEPLLKLGLVHLFSFLVWNLHPGTCRPRSSHAVASYQIRKPSHIAMFWQKGCFPGQAKSFTLRKNANILSKFLPCNWHGLITARWYGSTAIPSSTGNLEEALEVHRFRFGVGKFILSCLAFRFLFCICVKKGSSFEYCLVSVSNNSMAFGDVSFVSIVKVLSGFSSFTQLTC